MRDEVCFILFLDTRLNGWGRPAQEVAVGYENLDLIDGPTAKERVQMFRVGEYQWC
jgi:hypothetical protein